jgi:hypothetical protein
MEINTLIKSLQKIKNESGNIDVNICIGINGVILPFEIESVETKPKINIDYYDVTEDMTNSVAAIDIGQIICERNTVNYLKRDQEKNSYTFVKTVPTKKITHRTTRTYNI